MRKNYVLSHDGFLSCAAHIYIHVLKIPQDVARISSNTDLGPFIAYLMLYAFRAIAGNRTTILMSARGTSVTAASPQP